MNLAGDPTDAPGYETVISSANWRTFSDAPWIYSVQDSHVYLYLHSLLCFTFSSNRNIMKN